eukprot:CAMPEP_0114696504 /NCGR_PEP_ID=MMETSP0191-20121206/72646_1 /TAXON_ID=126664 /ORGANISM="Sorites sp." /LENGTH=153 /DNA_ID=CAMNT_0001994257 /DNA_START=484 /DNA_END=946 /DNA_ORIENTATION=-
MVLKNDQGWYVVIDTGYYGGSVTKSDAISIVSRLVDPPVTSVVIPPVLVTSGFSDNQEIVIVWTITGRTDYTGTRAKLVVSPTSDNTMKTFVYRTAGRDTEGEAFAVYHTDFTYHPLSLNIERDTTTLSVSITNGVLNSSIQPNPPISDADIM